MQTTQATAGVEKPISEFVLGSAWFSLSERELCFSLLDEFVAQGGNAVDTARLYGESEDVIGQWMAARGEREEIFLITKGSLSDEESTRLATECFEEKVERDLTTSLERLGADAVDLYLLHRDTPPFPVGAIIECLNRQLEAGRIRAFGGSNWQTRRIDEANDYAARHGLTGSAVLSNNLSLAVPSEPFYEGLISVGGDDREWLERTETPLVSWSSQARGFFTGRFRAGATDSPESAQDAFSRRMVEVYGTEDNYERLRRAEQLGKEKGGYSAVQVALAWLLHQPFRVFPVIGPRSQEELASCVGALDISLTRGESRWLDLETESPH